mmetsp:Transcript_18421/g.20476  ORF Transcript_18421/g.20476 Transcript_18421/m.20476 type:complete len:164 (+) Transcript_18421:34-525(+)
MLRISRAAWQPTGVRMTAQVSAPSQFVRTKVSRSKLFKGKRLKTSQMRHPSAVSLLFKGSPMRRGVVTKTLNVTPRKPNSAKRKVARVKLFHSGEEIYATIPGQDHNLHEHAQVLVRGSSPNDLPGINCSLVKGKYDFSPYERIKRSKRRSKFGIKKPREGDA